MAWLSAVNDERRLQGLTQIADVDLEKLLALFEWSWFGMARAFRQWKSRKHDQRSSDQFSCDVCGDSETMGHNLIVICECCSTAVHQECYGVPLIPEGPWLCRKCYLAVDFEGCVLCPWKSGALKPTTAAKPSWCHLLCARMLCGEASILNPTYQEPIDISDILVERWDLVCHICKIKAGAPVQCSVKTCHAAVHPKCARHVGCDVDMATKTLKCWRHSFVDKTASEAYCPHIDPIKIEKTRRSSVRHGDGPSAPTLPWLLVDRALAAMSGTLSYMPSKQRLHAVELCSRYWSLKRGYRRGAALIRSLEIEPWLATIVDANPDASLSRRRALKADLVRLQYIVWLVLQREKQKLAALLSTKEIVEILMDPLRTTLCLICHQLK